MLIYEKNKKLYGTETVPSVNDNEVTYKDENGTTITLNDNDSYFDNGEGGMTRKSDGKTVDMLFNDKYIIPRGKEAPVPPVGPTVITWDGDTTGKETVTVVAEQTYIMCKVSNKFESTPSAYVGGHLKSQERSGEHEVELTSEMVNEVVPGLIVTLEASFVVYQTTEIAGSTFTPGTWFAVSEDRTFYIKELSYGG